MEVVLKDIATIQPGFSFRGTISAKQNGEYRVIQIKDIDMDGNLLSGGLVKTDAPNIKAEYLVQDEDILLTTRGTQRRAAHVKQATANTIFVAQIFAIRNLHESVYPAYLAWYLGQKRASEYFETHATSSYIQNLRISDLAELPIRIPPPEKQRRIAEVYRLSIREKDLSEKIQARRSLLIEQALIKAIE
jgi:restriction endonuclease S subunit